MSRLKRIVRPYEEDPPLSRNKSKKITKKPTHSPIVSEMRVRGSIVKIAEGQSQEDPVEDIPEKILFDEAEWDSTSGSILVSGPFSGSSCITPSESISPSVSVSPSVSPSPEIEPERRTCLSCHYAFEVNTSEGKRAKYCPFCGAKLKFMALNL